MRKWTTSACVVLAVGLAALLAVAGYRTSSSHPAQANTSIATSTTSSTSSTSSLTQSAPAARPATLTAAVTAALAVDPPAATWVVRPGDTLTAIAAALAVPGGWHALYTANRAAIGPNPGIIQPGTILVTPRPAAARTAPAPVTSGAGTGHASPPARPSPAGSPRPGPTAGGNTTPASHQPAPGSGTATAGTMPRWLKGTLLAAALLTLIAFLAELGLAASRRRRRTDRTAPLRESAGTADQHRDAADQREADQGDTERTARIVEADHERLIVTYSVSDDTVYLLTPPGEDPRAVLRAARLVLPEDNYQELAGHLGVSPGWQE